MEMEPTSVSRQSLGASAGWLSDDEPPGFPEHNERNDAMKLRSIIEAHGGRLWATPNAGPGVTVQFTLPTSDEDAS
jgi:hypothetical protein